MSGGNRGGAAPGPRPAGGSTSRLTRPLRRAFKETFPERLRAAAVAAAWAFDEGRFGLKVWLRRRWCPRGERPPWIDSEEYEWLWAYVAVEPATGRCVTLYLPHVDPTCWQLFLDAFRAATGDTRIGLVLDGSGAHRSQAIVWPPGICPIRLPPYSPELNPAEQIFRHPRKRLSNRIFADLDAALTEALSEFWDHPPLLQRLTGYPWWLKATQAIDSLAS